MINKIYLFLLNIVISILDFNNKKKIISYFKKIFNNKPIVVIDVGAHKGETIKLFSNNFNIEKIFAFEANPQILDKLKKNTKKLINKKKLEIFNCGLSNIEEEKSLSVLNESSSSTFNDINENTDYFRRKMKILNLMDNKSFKKKINIRVARLSKYIDFYDIKCIDILKIDTEGYELKVLKGINSDQFNLIKYIYFEHHYDLMITKNYNFSDINNLLKNHNFQLMFKVRMPKRKTFEYIYERNDLSA